ncbi:FBD-associated F-box protein At4g13985-like [Silene latifolia]|uniref:FBD-associated F-box protein At4g13985-like n=1 Tax=Silene latifolia TaxID=37657 RepID=UPI003D7873CD
MEQNPNDQSILQHHRSISLPYDILNIIIFLLKFPQRTNFTISDSTFFIDLSEPVENNFSEFWNILDNLFTIFTAPSTNTFRIHLHETLFEEPSIRAILHSWTRRLRARNFQHVEIRSTCCFYGDKVFPPSIFQIHSLVSLNLDYIYFEEFDQFVSHPIILPNLKKLKLGVVDYGILEWLLSCCPSIEDLFFRIETTPTSNKGPSITSKNLKRLRISHFLARGPRDFIEIIIDAPTLEYLYFSGSFLSMRMFDLIPNVKALDLGGRSTTRLYNSTTKMIFPSWTHLTLHLGYEIFKAIFEQKMLHCPNLENLVLQFYGTNFYDFIWEPEAKFGLVEHVKHLELRMTVIRFNQRTLDLVTWLLGSAPVLEKLVLFANQSYSDDKSKAQFQQGVIEFAEDSSRCQIEFLGAFNKQEARLRWA